jgi:hypothetical protein
MCLRVRLTTCVPCTTQRPLERVQAIDASLAIDKRGLTGSAGVGLLCGPAIEFAAIVGAPFVRLRVCIPDAMWAGRLGALFRPRLHIGHIYSASCVSAMSMVLALLH